MSEVQYRMVAKIARDTHRQTGVDFDDLFQQGCLIYLEIMQSASYRKAVYEYGELQRRLWRFAKRCLKANHCELDSETLPSTESLIEQRVVLVEAIGRMKPETRTMFSLLQRNPHRYLALGQKKGRGQLRRDTIASGCSIQRTRSALRELTRFIQEVRYE